MENGPPNGAQGQGFPRWPDRSPKLLAIRLAEALQYSDCSPEDLWDEIGDWLSLNKVCPPNLAEHDLVAAPITSVGYRKYEPIAQSESASNLTRLIYASQHGDGDTVLEKVDDILRRSRENNALDAITGALVVTTDGFMQLLEGSRRAIGRCFLRIMKDERHTDIQIISCGDVSRRLFQDWKMHLIKASGIEREILSHYMINGAFTPALMSEFAIEDLCRALAEGNGAVRGT